VHYYAIFFADIFAEGSFTIHFHGFRHCDISMIARQNRLAISLYSQLRAAAARAISIADATDELPRRQLIAAVDML